MTTFLELTIVTTCSGYGQYLGRWAQSIVTQTVHPGQVIIFTHGTEVDLQSGAAAYQLLLNGGINATHHHHAGVLDFGAARNRAVDLATTDWVMHLDADDTLLPDAVRTFRDLAPEADVSAAGYVLAGAHARGLSTRDRVYHDGVGEVVLNHQSMAAGVSPFRKSFWTASPYREDMMGAWDTALWIGFARLGARFKATPRAVFQYWQHPDSIFNQRRTILGWRRVRTQAQLKALRRQYTGVAVVVPLGRTLTPDRVKVWDRVRAHYAAHHPEWEIIEGKCPDETWVKGAAIAVALEKTRAATLILADADCLVDPEALRKAVAFVRNGAAWAMPHRDVYRADPASSRAVLEAPAQGLPPLPPRLARPAYEGAPGGGIVVIERVNYEAIGGIPHAFRGWGSEDRALSCLAETLLGPCARGTAPLLHLYHEPQPRGAQSNANLQLLRVLGAAAQKGKDALVSVAYTMPSDAGRNGRNAVWKMNSGTARPVITPQQVMANTRRRVPWRAHSLAPRSRGPGWMG